MAEWEIRSIEPVIAARRLTGVLAQRGAVECEPGAGVAGAVDAAWRRWTLPDGRLVELWSDSWTPLSIRCERPLADEIAAAAGLDIADE